MINLLKSLLSISDNKWGQYAFSRDPLNHRLTPEIRDNLIEKSMKCGIHEAQILKEQYGILRPIDYADKFGVKINLEDSYGSEDYIMFARFNEPKDITIFTANIKKTNEFLHEYNLNEFLGHVDICNMLIAHELYHYCESQQSNIFTRQKHIKLWHIGPIVYRSNLITTKEIAAMAFAKELVGINFNPFLFDILMLCPHDFEKASVILKHVIG